MLVVLTVKKLFFWQHFQIVYWCGHGPVGGFGDLVRPRFSCNSPTLLLPSYLLYLGAKYYCILGPLSGKLEPIIVNVSFSFFYYCSNSNYALSVFLLIYIFKIKVGFLKPFLLIFLRGAINCGGHRFLLFSFRVNLNNKVFFYFLFFYFVGIFCS